LKEQKFISSDLLYKLSSPPLPSMPEVYQERFLKHTLSIPFFLHPAALPAGFFIQIFFMENITVENCKQKLADVRKKTNMGI